MANTTSGTHKFEKHFSIDEIIEESFERMGIQNVTGYQLKTSRRSLNIMFQEWANRGIHYWQVNNTSFTLATNQKEYQIFILPDVGILATEPTGIVVVALLVIAVVKVVVTPLESPSEEDLNIWYSF